uniref:Uncharacterized protein n=1 Tax=Helianthus annuus TaxID=4232 RepID=A0A251SL30_HELAN
MALGILSVLKCRVTELNKKFRGSEKARHWWAMIGDPGRVGYRVFRGIGGGLGLLLKYSVCPVGAPRELRIDLSAVQQKL